MASKALHILLALAVLISSSGLVLNQHFCQGKRKGMALYVHADGCRMAGQSAACAANQPRHGQEMRHNCCSDRSDYLKLAQDQQQSSSPLPLLKPPVALLPLLNLFSFDQTRHTSSTLPYLAFKPPIVCNDFQSRLQTFRL